MHIPPEIVPPAQGPDDVLAVELLNMAFVVVRDVKLVVILTELELDKVGAKPESVLAEVEDVIAIPLVLELIEVVALKLFVVEPLAIETVVRLVAASLMGSVLVEVNAIVSLEVDVLTV